MFSLNSFSRAFKCRLNFYNRSSSFGDQRGARNSPPPPPSGARYKNTPVGRGLNSRAFSICLPAPNTGTCSRLSRARLLRSYTWRQWPPTSPQLAETCAALLPGAPQPSPPRHPLPTSPPSLLRMRNFVPCATNHVAMFSFVVLATDDGGAGFALTVEAVEATRGLGWGRP